MLTRPEHSRPRPRPNTIKAKAKATVPTLKAKAKAKAMAMAIPMQRLMMKYEVMKSCFSSTLTGIQSYKHSLIISLITDMIHR